MSDSLLERLRDLLEIYRHAPADAQVAHQMYDELCQLLAEYDNEEEG